MTHIVVGMTDFREWAQSAHRIRVTASDVADILGISRATATRNLLDGLTSDQIITLCRNLDTDPVQALVDLGKLTEAEIFQFLDNGAKLMDTATDGELSLELARRLNPASMAEQIKQIETRTDPVDELERHRSNKPRAVSSPTDTDDDGTVREFNWDTPHAADGSPEENEERLKRGEDPAD